ncbi:ATP synthase d subunit [Clydaea vesicula]|uniref:ATP synthase subunit d, mitochondrial n=1 Tax=Clydaea vesicula TaxID=447962 RepID=A0AAD5XRR5_9FUNG|nr:ATP synthase d subunit [Clydaea vesicula]KAJ3387654.1 ATP synthase d subunit [Lobulomyces angularis]
MSSVKSIASKIDWPALSQKLKPDTLAAVSNFRRRHMELAKQLQDLKEQNRPIDFSFYKNTLKNKTVVENAEKAFAAFKPSTFDLSKQNDIIRDQEAKAIEAAKKTELKVKKELGELDELLQNIKTARPVDELTVEDVTKILPEIDENTAKLAKRGQWTVPGYYEKFGEFKIGF